MAHFKAQLQIEVVEPIKNGDIRMCRPKHFPSSRMQLLNINIKII